MFKLKEALELIESRLGKCQRYQAEKALKRNDMDSFDSIFTEAKEAQS
jgi:hypothetical protein